MGILPFLTISLLVSSTAVSTTAVKPGQKTSTDKDFIRETCRNTEELNDLCLSVIKSDPRSELKSNLTGFLLVFVDHTLSNASATYSRIIQLYKNRSLDEHTSTCLRFCFDKYTTMVDDLKESRASLINDHITAISAPLADVVGNADDCEKCFSEFPSVHSPLTSQYNNVHGLGYIALDVSNIIQCGHAATCIPS